MHDVFYVFMLRKHLCDKERYGVIDFSGLVLYVDISMEVHPIQIMEL